MNFHSWIVLLLLGLANVSSAEEPKPTGPYNPPKAASPQEQLAQSDIMEVVLTNKSDIVKCVKAQWKKEPENKGRLMMSWAIRKDGTTHNVKCTTLELCDTLLAQCLTEEIKTWTFPRHQKEGEPTIFPFTF